MVSVYNVISFAVYLFYHWLCSLQLLVELKLKMLEIVQLLQNYSDNSI